MRLLIFLREESINHTLWDAKRNLLLPFSSRNFVIPLAPHLVLPNGLCVGSRASNITQSSCVSARETFKCPFSFSNNGFSFYS